MIVCKSYEAKSSESQIKVQLVRRHQSSASENFYSKFKETNS